MDQFQKLKDLITSAEADAEKFYNKGNAAASTRLRKAMQGIKVAAQRIVGYNSQNWTGLPTMPFQPIKNSGNISKRLFVLMACGKRSFKKTVKVLSMQN